MKYSTTLTIMEDLYDSGGKKEYWCSVLYFSDFKKSPVRNVSPIKVKITLNIKKYEEYKESKWGSYYSSWITIDTLGSKVKKTLNHNGRCGAGEDNLVYFDSEQECQEYYNDRVFSSINYIEIEKQKQIQTIDKQIEKMKKSFHNSDYMIETLRRN